MHNLVVSKRPNTLASQDLRRDRPVNAGVAPPLHGTLAPWRGRRVGGGCRGVRSWPGPGWRRWRPARWPSTRECCPAGPRCTGTSGSTAPTEWSRRSPVGAPCRAASCRRRAAVAAAGGRSRCRRRTGRTRGRRCRWPSCCTAAAGTTPRRSTRVPRPRPVPGAGVGAGAAPFAMASVDGGETYWHRRADGEDAGAMVVDEFCRCSREHGLDVGRRPSSGGRWAGTAPSGSPGCSAGTGSSAATAMSPALWHGFADTAPGAFDDAADFADVTVFGRQRSSTGCGCESTAARATRSTPPTRDYVEGFRAPPAGGFQRGGHDAGYWRRVAPRPRPVHRRGVRGGPTLLAGGGPDITDPDPSRSPGRAPISSRRYRLGWRWRWDLNPRWACTHTRFRGVLLRPLGHATADEVTGPVRRPEIGRTALGRSRWRVEELPQQRGRTRRRARRRPPRGGG